MVPVATTLPYNKRMKHHLAYWACLLWLLPSLNAQAPAIAYSLQDIVIDGHLQDWPKDLPTYDLTHYYGPDRNGQDTLN